MREGGPGGTCRGRLAVFTDVVTRLISGPMYSAEEDVNNVQTRKTLFMVLWNVWCCNFTGGRLVRLEQHSKRWRPPDWVDQIITGIYLMVGWFLRSGEAHLLRYGSTGRENATRSPVQRSIRCRRARTRTCLPTAPSAAAPAGVGWGRKGHIVAAAAVSPQSCGHSARRRARSGVLNAGEKAANKWNANLDQSITAAQTKHTRSCFIFLFKNQPSLKSQEVLATPSVGSFLRTTHVWRSTSFLLSVTGRKSVQNKSATSALTATAATMFRD